MPDRVTEVINKYDVLNDWCGKINESNCPICERDLYVFDWKHDSLIVDEYGDHHNFPEYICDKAGYYWNAAGDEGIMCQVCHENGPFPEWRPETSSNSVRVFYGETGEFSRFSHHSGVIRWDSDYDKSTDLWNLREDDGNLIHGYEIAAAFAKGRSQRNEMMERCGFKKVHVKELDQKINRVRSFWRFAKDVLTGWATLDSKTMTEEPTHPDLKFTYIIEGKYQAWVPKEHVEKFKAELIWQSLQEASDYDEAKEFIEDNNGLLIYDYYGVTID